MWPERYLVDGYYDEKGQLRREIIVEHAKQVADMLAERGLTSASMRRFYSKVLGVTNKFRTLGNFDMVRPQIDKLEADVAYAVKRGVVPPAFETFIQKNVRLATVSQQGLLGFFQHFQSVVAFSPNTEGGGQRSHGNSGNRRPDKPYGGASYSKDNHFNKNQPTRR
ncbi:type III-A CRISPR-associated protein Csm2 [Paenibacillus tyrfis]|uniref:type III-A CRISPR-associated protein Csm2 n=1 Tax=Paenibacillus tyrfis TaxID=1501230 RepID=UPI00068A5EB4|nr:type III-A CRISPR-associated protein Csm2 [Paenibacillus tyrfis]